MQAITKGRAQSAEDRREAGLSEVLSHELNDRGNEAKMNDKVACEKIIQDSTIFDLLVWCPYVPLDMGSMRPQPNSLPITTSFADEACGPVQFSLWSMVTLELSFIVVAPATRQQLRERERHTTRLLMQSTSWSGLLCQEPFEPPQWGEHFYFPCAGHPERA